MRGSCGPSTKHDMGRRDARTDFARRGPRGWGKRSAAWRVAACRELRAAVHGSFVFGSGHVRRFRTRRAAGLVGRHDLSGRQARPRRSAVTTRDLLADYLRPQFPGRPPRRVGQDSPRPEIAPNERRRGVANEVMTSDPNSGRRSRTVARPRIYLRPQCPASLRSEAQRSRLRDRCAAVWAALRPRGQGPPPTPCVGWPGVSIHVRTSSVGVR